MSVIRAAQVAAEEAAGLAEHDEESAAVEATAEQVSEVKAQFVFTMTDAGYAKRTRINEYRLTGRGGLGITTMRLTNEERGGLVGAFIVEDGDEILSITQGGQVVRSPIDTNFKPSVGRSTQGVKFVTPKNGDAVAVVARSVETKVDEEDAVGTPRSDDGETHESPVADPDVTIESEGSVETGDSGDEESPGESEG
jgi:DNA gyrase subunit A